MFKTKTHKTFASLTLGLACLAAPSAVMAIQPVQMTGALTGIVKNSSGIPQMGAAVQIFNKQERLIGRVLTDDRGQFKLLGLLPNIYSIKVSLATYVPVIKRDILVQPGMRSMLSVSLSTLFSTIQLSYPTSDAGGIMSDDWKWVLRSSSTTRPVLRFVEDGSTVDASTLDTASTLAEPNPLFSDTHGLVRLSAGEGTLLAGIATEADMGTAFAVATSVAGKSLLQVSGNFGYGSASGAPAAAFRTSFSHNLMGGNPEISLTMRQLIMPVHVSADLAGDALPMLRTMSASFDDHKQLADNVTLQYGFSLDMVSFMEHINYYSPYARLRYDLSRNSTLEMAYSSGNARPNLSADAGPADEADLQHDLSTLGLFPRMSLAGGKPQIQRGTEYELAFTHKMGSRAVKVTTYREHVSNLALSMVAPGGFFGGTDVLPDLFSGNSIFNIGTFGSTGFTGALTQSLGAYLSATVIAGSGGALTTADRQLVSNSPDELRSMIRAGRRNAVTAKVAATSPWTGTHLIASYQWTGDQRWAMPGNLYSTQAYRPMPGFNLMIRQPIPGLGKRVEATADLRNLLAQGYLPIGTADGQTILLVENPRCFRGGLSFIF
ncbi:MAG TPA: TonB-dependent receptor [Candidatus Limnocylindrales bacterium]|nr:TonB-dependent receptor [Candidatus Limnocylindrales bacterium]